MDSFLSQQTLESLPEAKCLKTKCENLAKLLGNFLETEPGQDMYELQERLGTYERMWDEYMACVTKYCAYGVVQPNRYLWNLYFSKTAKIRERIAQIEASRRPADAMTRTVQCLFRCFQNEN